MVELYSLQEIEFGETELTARNTSLLQKSSEPLFEGEVPAGTEKRTASGRLKSR